MLGKTLLSLDEIARTLKPDVTPNAIVRKHAAALMEQRMAGSMSPGRLLSGVLEAKELIERLPERLNRILDRLANNEIEVKVDAIDEAKLMEGSRGANASPSDAWAALIRRALRAGRASSGLSRGLAIICYVARGGRVA